MERRRVDALNEMKKVIDSLRHPEYRICFTRSELQDKIQDRLSEERSPSWFRNNLDEIPAVWRLRGEQEHATTFYVLGSFEGNKKVEEKQ